MPLKVGTLQTEPVTIEVPVGEDKLSITYNRRALTPRLLREVSQAASKDDDLGSVAGGIQQLLRLLLDWDVVDEDGNKLEISEETLIDLPMAFLTDMVNAIWENINPNPPRPEENFGSLS